MTMDWNLCLICKEETGEKLRCPIDRKNSDAHDVYQTFLQNVDEFRTLGALPVNLESSSMYNVETFIDKKGKWHHSCHQSLLIQGCREQRIAKENRVQMMIMLDARNASQLKPIWRYVYSVEKKTKKNFTIIPQKMQNFPYVLWQVT